MPEQERQTLTKDDLNRVFIRVQNDDGSFSNVDCNCATSKQFDTWARGRMQIQGGFGLWSPEERADFCNQLYRAGALAVLKKDVNLE